MGASYRVAPIDFNQYKAQLISMASSLAIPFEYQALQTSLEKLTPEILQMRKGEVLLVHGAMRFHTLSDGSVIRSSPRDAALKAIRKLEPRLFLLGEKHVDHNGPFFLKRFTDAIEYYNAVFESVDHHMPRDSELRHTFEQNLLGRDIINVVSCEGLQRISRCETLDQWRARMKDAGFVNWPLKQGTVTEVRKVLRKFMTGWDVVEEEGALLLAWRGKPLLATSTWRISS